MTNFVKMIENVAEIRVYIKLCTRFVHLVCRYLLNEGFHGYTNIRYLMKQFIQEETFFTHTESIKDAAKSVTSSANTCISKSEND